MRHSLLILAALCSAVPAAAQAGETAAPFVANDDPADFDQALQCLTQAVYYEARSQSDDGQRAVAQVVLNRVRHPAYPNNVCGVVFQGSERSTGCQFSFTCDGSMYRAIEPSAWTRAERIARAALAGSVYRPVGLALNYHTTSIRPYWAPSLVPQAVIGAHVFYRRPGSTEANFTQTPGAEMASAPAVTSRSFVPRSQRGLAGGGQRLRYETAVMEIPVVERPVRELAIGGSRRPTVTRAAAVRRSAAPGGARVTIEGGVRVARGG